MIVYSDHKHVPNIEHALMQIENALRKKGFNPLRLSTEIHSDDDYLERVRNLIDSSALAVVVLDGFRPNVIFEWGYLKGVEKPIILLKSKQAVINIKSLFSSEKETRLKMKQFERLQNPVLSINRHLSDYAGKHVVPIRIPRV